MSHAKLSPSSAARWLRCLGSTLGVQLDTDSEYADDGTASHTLAGCCLIQAPGIGANCVDYIGAKIDVKNDDGTVRRSFVVDEERATYVQVYIDAVRDRMHEGAQLLVEQRVDTGIRDDEGNPVDGTGDAIILSPTFGLIDVHDLKYGSNPKNKVWSLKPIGHGQDAPVGPLIVLDGVIYEMNPQLALYGLGALNTFGLLGGFTKVQITIHQPRLDHTSSAIIDVADLQVWGEQVAAYVKTFDATLNPGEEQCRWCPKNATCKALTDQITETVMNEFANIADLTEHGIAAAYERVELIKNWLNAIETAARSLADKDQLPGWKLVDGRQGNRAWTDEKIVADIFKSKYRLKDDEMYNKKLISPTDAEKRFAKTSQKRWEDLQDHIKRGPPSKTLVRVSDSRPAVGSKVIDDFKTVGEFGDYFEVGEFGDLMGVDELRSGKD